MSDNNTPLIQNRGPLIRFDGTIPAWGIILLGVGWATYSWTTMQDLNNRLVMREAGAMEYRKKVDNLEVNRTTDLALWNNINADVRVMKELLVRIERRIPEDRRKSE